MSDSKTVFFLSHGGGPLPLLGDPNHIEMVTLLQKIAAEIRRPSAILVISAHWEENVATVTSGAHPDLIYDYYNFPAESYEIQYPCPGHPELAQSTQIAMKRAGIASESNSSRGFDHGLFIPLKVMYPEADIPCIQLSLLNSLNPENHLRLGEALQGLEQENLLVIGSGFSFHNMQAFFKPDDTPTRAMNHAFEDWLKETCSDPSVSEPERRARLLHWDKAPHARYCHPREEHLIPLHVCYGLAQSSCSESYSLNILSKRASMYLWRSKDEIG